ncbi:hypothetical protein LCGC14_3020680, partial [marine sediment metagenome]
MRRKNVLMISYFFPPRGGPGVQRTLYFAKYLSDFGYRPLVVHGGRRPAGGPQDTSLLEELNSQVLRFEFPAFEPACLTRPFSKWLNRRGRISQGLAWRLDRLTGYLEQCVSPDELVFWADRMTNPVIQLAKRYKARMIYSTADPFSNHYLAWRVKKALGLPWVADFRDLWTQDQRYNPKPRFRARRDSRYEQ